MSSYIDLYQVVVLGHWSVASAAEMLLPDCQRSVEVANLGCTATILASQTHFRELPTLLPEDALRED